MQSESMPRLLMRLALPAIVAQLVNALYSMVDRMYIGNIPGYGSLALTGIGITFPIIIFITAFTNLIGMGGAPLVSIALGERDEPQAHRILGNCFVLLVGAALLLTAVTIVFARPLLYAFGASDDTVTYAQPYLCIYASGTIFVMLSLGLNPFMNAQGNAKASMLTVSIGAAINILLDPLFIFVFHMGVSGAAIATVISQAVSCIWVLKYLTGKKSQIRIKKSCFRLKADIVRRVLALGFSPFIMYSTESLVQITINTSLRHYGGDLYVGAMTIITSIAQVKDMPLTGFGTGAQPIMGYNYGAGNIRRVKECFRLLMGISVVYALTVYAFLMLKPEWFIVLFNSDPELLELTKSCMRIQLSTSFVMSVQNSIQQALVALGQARTSVFIALLRKIILLIPIALILPLFVGVNGIFMADAIASVISATTACLLFRRVSRQVLAEPAA